VRQLVGSRWFALADLALVLVCGVIWIARPQWGVWVLWIALLPWLARIVTGQFGYRFSGLEFPIAIFLLTAGAGVWAAYDSQAAWAKFWVLVAAVLIYAALAGQPDVNLGVVAGLTGLMGVMIAVYFSLSYDWHLQSSDFNFINRMGRAWMAIRPELVLRPANPNVVGGLLAMLAFFPLALGLNSWRERRYIWAALACASTLLILTGLLLTSSRGAWVAFGVALGFWIAWGISDILARPLRLTRSLIFALLLCIGVLPIAWFVLSFPGGLLGLLDRLPGLADGSSRLDLARSALDLIGDAAFTGGGLWAFPGLFSQYIMVTPYFIYNYSHDFYLDVALEQGVVGGVALLMVFLLSGWALASRMGKIPGRSLIATLSLATLASLVAVLLHGLVDDALYSSRGTPLLLLVPGIAVSLYWASKPAESQIGDTSKRGLVSNAVLLGLAILFGLLLLIGWRKPLQASWQANMGSVQLARLDLAGWPSEKWNEDSDVSATRPAQTAFLHSLTLNPANRTANHRMGLIAMQAREYLTAKGYLEMAHSQDSKHRGVIKSLGYCYVWLDQLEDAAELLADIPEAEYEMGVYSWWWKTQGRADLADRALEMKAILHDLKSTTSGD
jgi:hypothetical protein